MARAPERIGWKVAAARARRTGRTRSRPGRRAPAAGSRSTASRRAQTALGGVARVLWLTPAMDRLWLEGAGERRRFLDRVALSLVPEHGEAALGYDRALRERNRLIRDEVRDAGWFDGAGGADGGVRGAAERRTARRRWRGWGRRRRARFPRAELPSKARGRGTRPGWRPPGARAGRATLAAGRTLVGPHRDDLGGGLRREGGGGAALLDRGAEGAADLRWCSPMPGRWRQGFGAAPVLLLDEVAAHLDAGRRRGALCGGRGARGAGLDDRDRAGAVRRARRRSGCGGGGGRRSSRRREAAGQMLLGR